MTKLQEKKIPKFQTSGKFDLSEIEGDSRSIDELRNPQSVDPFVQDREEQLARLDALYNVYARKNNFPTRGEQLSQTGWENYENEVPTRYGTKDYNYAGLIKPAISGLSAWFNLDALKRARVAADIKSPRVDAATVANRPVEGIPPEILNLALKNIGGLNIKKTSDAGANIVANQMLNQQKLKAMDSLAGMQTENLGKERDRYGKTEAANKMATVQAGNEQAKFAIDAYNKRSMLDAQYEGAKKDTVNRLVEEALIKPMSDAMSYNIQSAAITDSKNWSRIQDQIVNAQNAMIIDPNSQKAKKAYKDALDKQKAFIPTKTPQTFRETYKWMFKNPNKIYNT